MPMSPKPNTTALTGPRSFSNVWRADVAKLNMDSVVWVKPRFFRTDRLAAMTCSKKAELK